FNTVGPRQTGRYGMVLPNFVRQALANEPITVYGTGKQSRCFAYVGDVVKALSQLIRMEKAYGEVFNLGSNELVSIEDLALRVRSMINSRSEMVHIPYEQAYEEGFEDMMSRIPSLEKAAKWIGYKPATPLSETIERVIAYERKRLAPVNSEIQ
ncbi:MAG: NAD-dependent epimerase/dehydratase family protein, partial [Candidatus Dormibacteria bacterium]